MKRVAVPLATVVVALAGTLALIAFFQSRDDAGIGSDGDNAAASENAPGTAAPDETDKRLAAGNVILTYRRKADGEKLRALAEDIAGPPDESLEEVGQAIIVLARPNQSAGQVVGHALNRRLVVETADDPQVRTFIEYFLGRAAETGG
jgi:hypothetical protein